MVVIFAATLSRLTQVRTPSPRICVLAEYLATLFYLAAEIESGGQTCHVFHGGMNAESRQNALTLFSEGGILASTRAAMSRGVALGEVTDLILYVPENTVALQQILGRFDRFGRRTQLSVHTLVPSNTLEGSVTDSLRLLREALGAAEPRT